MRRFMVLVLAVTSLGVVGGSGPAAAGEAPCVFDAMTATLTVTGMRIARVGDSIAVDDQVCGAATVMNTDAISVVGAGDLRIDLRGGPLAPGATPEAEGVDEIEITVSRDGITIGITGTGGIDRIKPATDLDQGEINLNAAEVPKDPDVTFAQMAVELLIVEGRGANDSVVAHGHGETPYVGDVWFFAGRGDDRYVPGKPGGEGSTFIGYRGHDTFDFSWLPASQSLLVMGQNGGGAYGDPPTGWLISFEGVEEVTGHVGPDEIYGSAADEWIQGLGGRDVLHGRGGDDHISSEGEATIDAGAGDDECLVFPEVLSIRRCERVVYAVV